MPELTVPPRPQDMSPLFPDIIACLSIQVLEIKKMVYLYLINYARVKPEMVVHAMGGFLSVSAARLPEDPPGRPL